MNVKECKKRTTVVEGIAKNCAFTTITFAQKPLRKNVCLDSFPGQTT